jgi:hypothetical protein
MKIEKWWIENLIKISSTIIIWAQFRKHLTRKKIFHLYDKFQKRSSKKTSRELDQNDESRDRELDEIQTIWIKSLKKRAL